MLFRKLCTVIFMLASGFQAAALVNLPLEAASFPSCSLQCLSTALASAPGVSQNFKLLCANPGLEKSLADCVRGTCNFADQQKVVGINNGLCKDQPVQTAAIKGTIVLGILGILTQTAIGLRFYARMKLAPALGIGLDDYLLLAASGVIAFVQISGTVEVLMLGLGKHTFNVPPEDLLPNLLLYWFDEIAYQIAMTLIKTSILCFYLRLFADHHFRLACYAMLTFVTLNGLIFLFVTVFQCRPIRGVFDKSIDAICLDNNTATFASSGVSIAIDFMILLMPIPRLLQLKVSKGRRNAVLFTFSFGFIASVISIIRLPFIIQFGKTTDPLFDNIGPSIWTVTEMCSAVIAACLPALKPLADRLFPKMFSDEPSANPITISWPQLRHPNNSQGPPNHNPHLQQDERRGLGPVSRILNSLFSRGGQDEGIGMREKYFKIKEGKIEMVLSRFSRLSVGFLKVDEEKLVLGEKNGKVEWVEGRRESDVSDKTMGSYGSEWL